MAFDALLKKYFAVAILLLVALLAYFQARGASELVGAALSPSGNALAAAPPSRQSRAVRDSSLSSEPKSAERILERNPFDSVTGPLNAKPIEAPTVKNDPDLSNPLAAPACDGVRLEIVTESPDPTWSLAAVQAPGDSTPVIRRVGDDISGKQVAYIGYNPRENSPAVWLTSGSALCQALLFKQQPTVAAAAPTPAVPSATRSMMGAPSLPADISSKIQKVSDNEFNVDRSVVDKILENQAQLMSQARIVPEQKDGKVVGIRLFGIRPDTLLGTLGFQNGDRLEAINGFNMSSPEKALEAYARLRTASNLNVKVNRRGSPMSIDFRIK